MAEEVSRRGGNKRSENGIEKDTANKNDMKYSQDLINKVNLQKIRDKAGQLKTDFLDNVDSQLNTLFDDFVQEVEKIEQHPFTQINGETNTFRNIQTLIDMNIKYRDRRKVKEGELPDKEFIARRSVLTELLEISHIRTIYHIFVAILIVFSLNTFVYDIIDKGRLVVDFDMMWWSFGKFPIVMSLWFCMTISSILLVFPAYQYWANNRLPGKKGRIIDYCWLGMYVVYQVIFLVLPVRIVLLHRLPPTSSIIIVTEQVRLVMKVHAFVRENIPRALNWKKGEDNNYEEDTPCPDFSKYLYFLFAPTLVYRDSYPRTQSIRWNYVVSNFAQVLACLFYTYYIFIRFCVPVFQNFNREHVTPKALLLSAFSCMLPGTLVLFVGFFAILHSWLNAFAEMLKFGDRLFYKDWWNSTSFANYYRTWNVVVHDWLYTYVYKDCYKVTMMLGIRNRGPAMASVFLLSAVFHEYILSVAFGYFYPVLFVLFSGAGFGFIFLTQKKVSRSWNVFMWVSLFIGDGIIMSLYSMEWYARQRCPVNTDSYLDYVIPKSWTCDFAGIH